jgi:hypothetical protein
VNLNIDRFICDGFNVYRNKSTVQVYYRKYIRQIQQNAPRVVWFRPPQNPISKAARGLAESAGFKTFSMICVGINICFLLSDHAGCSAEFERMLDLQNYIFFWELLFEVTLGVIAYGPFGGVLDDRWRAFDFLILLITAISYITVSKTGSTLAKVMRPFQFWITNIFVCDDDQFSSQACRLLRVIRLMRMFKVVKFALLLSRKRIALN